ncbi:hypothetical protein E2C01_053952 [Portunus trituberculatus]|uniref:Uncharacterized protein n=1 Tax=Portunus trituberculatus TaxID=210409 RepID=A0A5B7GLU8_PORTR|nr:hypothetical protein [Portunus trituberculatus]
MSDGETPLVPEQRQESEEQEDRCEEELLVLNAEESRGRDGRGSEKCKAEEEDKEASHTCGNGQESHTTDSKGEGSPAAPTHAASTDVGVVRRVASKLLKVAWVAVTFPLFFPICASPQLAATPTPYIAHGREENIGEAT